MSRENRARFPQAAAFVDRWRRAGFEPRVIHVSENGQEAGRNDSSEWSDTEPPEWEQAKREYKEAQERAESIAARRAGLAPPDKRKGAASKAAKAGGGTVAVPGLGF
jgi:hypothetical protein